jgi:hypothetical protein
MASYRQQQSPERSSAGDNNAATLKGDLDAAIQRIDVLELNLARSAASLQKARADAQVAERQCLQTRPWRDPQAAGYDRGICRQKRSAKCDERTLFKIKLRKIVVPLRKS